MHACSHITGTNNAIHIVSLLYTDTGLKTKRLYGGLEGAQAPC